LRPFLPPVKAPEKSILEEIEHPFSRLDDQGFNVSALPIPTLKWQPIVAGTKYAAAVFSEAYSRDCEAAWPKAPNFTSRITFPDAQKAIPIVFPAYDNMPAIR